MSSASASGGPAVARPMTTQQRVLVASTAASVFGVLLMLVSISTDYWVQLVIPPGVYRNASKAYVIGHHSGLWRICRTEVDNVTHPTMHRDYCNRLKLFPSKEEIFKDPEIDGNILDYSRSETAFAVISVGLMGLGIIFSIYAVKEPRYMFKRLAGMLHVMVALCILVSAEVLISSVNYERGHLPARHPDGAYLQFGFSFGLAWVVFAIYVIAAIINFAYGRKRKGDAASSDKEALENEPVHLGRF